MKVTFNQATQVNNFAQSTACYTKNTLGRNGKTVPVCGALPSTEAFLTSMPNLMKQPVYCIQNLKKDQMHSPP